MIQNINNYSTEVIIHNWHCKQIKLSNAVLYSSLCLTSSVKKCCTWRTLYKESIVMTVIPLWYFTIFYIKIPVSEVSGECMVV